MTLGTIPIMILSMVTTTMAVHQSISTLAVLSDKEGLTTGVMVGTTDGDGIITDGTTAVIAGVTMVGIMAGVTIGEITMVGIIITIGIITTIGTITMEIITLTAPSMGVEMVGQQHQVQKEEQKVQGFKALAHLRKTRLL